ncbi:hypothetical protein RUND412_007922 [Rhizina undulata]
MNAGPKLKFYIDVVSPYTYLAFHVIRDTPAFRRCNITYVPVFLGGIMHATGNRPPITIKNKGAYMPHDLERWATKFGVPMARGTPKGFPLNTLLTQRSLVALQRSHPDVLEVAMEKLLEALWVERKSVDTEEVLVDVLSSIVVRNDAKEIVARAKNDETVKARLKENTEDALESGSFGLPWIVATNSEGKTDVFWGFDHLGLVADFLGLDVGVGKEIIGGEQGLVETREGRKGWRSLL